MNKRENENKIIDRIDKEQINEHSEIGTDYEPITRDPPFPEYGKLDSVDGDRPHTDANPIIPNSMRRFCIDHTNEISESDLRANKGMRLNQKSDDTASPKKGKSVQNSDEQFDEDVLSGLA